MKKTSLLCVLLASMSLLISGCSEKMIELSEEEADIIAAYSAKVVANRNVNQKEGVTVISLEQLEAEQQQQEEVSTEEVVANEQGDPSSTETKQEIPKMSLTDVIGVSGLTFQFVDFSVQQDYQSGDTFMLSPKKGYGYLVANIKAINTTEQPLEIDLLNKEARFEVVVNGVATSVAETTILLNDLSTAKEVIPAKEEKDYVLLFQVKEEQLSDITSIEFQVKMNGATHSIEMK